MRTRFFGLVETASAAAVLAMVLGAGVAAQEVRTDSGIVEGTKSGDGNVEVFRGIPYAAPPVGDLRWKAPQPVAKWTGVKKADTYGPRCMQGNVFGDMVFHDAGPSEDCLYLNVWTPGASPKAKLPVMVWVYGGGFQAGATSEGRQDGQTLAHRGVVVVSMNYRLGIFGFFSHAELTKESPRHASGNYGLLDQAAALEWVKKNIRAFGGDPQNVTVFGESAGSFSVCALMASPVSRGLMHRAIGESGAFFGRTLSARPLAQSEADGAKFGETIGAATLQQLRAIPAQQLLETSMKDRNAFRFGPNIDGYFFPENPAEIYKRGEQAHIDLLAGWNHDEGNFHMFFGKDAATKENYTRKIEDLNKGDAPEVLKLFPGETDEQAKESAGLLATANFIGYGTWKWIETQAQLRGPAVYRYEFDQPRPLAATGEAPGAVPLAVHSAEIEYVFGMLKTKDLPWQPEDFQLSEQMSAYWTNFAKKGDPNGEGLPDWPRYDVQDGYEVMHLAPTPHNEKDGQRAQYELLDKMYAKPQASGGN